MGLFENRIYDGVPEMLEESARRARALFVATAKLRHAETRIVTHFDLARHFESIHGAESGGRFDAKEDLLGFTGFPAKHWRQIWSTNPLERVNKEIKRRTDVVGVFPNPAALLRLAGAVLVEQHDEWEAGDRRYFSAASMAELADMNNPTKEVQPMPEITAA